jgi:DNA (cytosine-5)-methyltransferase 1
MNEREIKPQTTTGPAIGYIPCCTQPFKILNLYAGLGGNRVKWSGNIHVTAVEMEEDIANVYKKNFPNDTVIIGDAHKYLLENADDFDFIWSSPPCQTHSRMMKATRHKLKRYTDMSLYQEILFLQHFYKGKWVVENVKPFYEPLVKPTAILGRHYFWANFNISQFEVEQPKGFITSGTQEETQKLKDWLGIQYEGNIYYKDNHCPGQVLRNCVHPLLGLHVFNSAKNIKTQIPSKQIALF